MRRALVALAVACLCWPGVARGQHASLETSLWGYYEFYTGHFVAAPLDFLSGWNRIRLNGQLDHEHGKAIVSGRLTQSFVDPQEGGAFTAPVVRLWEGYLDVYTPSVDIRIGRQVVVWGQTDGAFITDVVSPLDLSQFLAQDITDIRLPIPAASASYYSGPVAVTGLVTLLPVETILPSEVSPWFVVPDLRDGFDVGLSESNLPGFGIENMEPATRISYFGIDRTEIHLIYLYGFNRIPAFGAQILTTDLGADIVPTYYRRHVIGTRWSTAATDPWVVDSELAYESRLDVETDPLSRFLSPDDAGFLASSGHVHGMVGIERAIGGTFGRVQLLGSYLTRYQSDILRDRFIPSVTGYLRRSLHRETLIASMFVSYNLGQDAWLNPAVQWSPGQGFNLFAGAHVFAGDDRAGGISTSAFSLYDENDHFYVRVTQHF